MQSFETELKRGILELVLLRLLAQRAKYGYELVKELRQSTGDRFRVKEGTLYPVLYRLEDQQLIEPEWHAEGRGNPRKYYSLTKAGELRLSELRRQWFDFAEWVTSMIGEDDQTQQQRREG